MFTKCHSVLLLFAQESTNKDNIEATRAGVDEVAVGSHQVKYCLLKKRVLTFMDCYSVVLRHAHPSATRLA